MLFVTTAHGAGRKAFVGGRLVALACGTTLALAFDPVGWGLLAPIALGVFFARVGRVSSTKVALIDGYLFGVAFLGAHMWWLVDSIGTGAWVALTSVESLWFALAYAATFTCRHRKFAPLIAAAAWTSAEILRQIWPFGGFPWGQLGVSALDTPLETAMPYVGVTGTSFLVAFVAATCAREATPPSTFTWTKLGLVAGAAVVSLVPPYSSISPSSASSRDASRTEPRSAVIALVQPGVPGDGRDVVANRDEILASNLAQTHLLAQRVASSQMNAPDLVVWAEGAAGSSPADNPTANDAISAAARQVRSPILVGSINAGPTKATRYNQGVVWTASGPLQQPYTKMHPVPFGEYVPGRRFIAEWSSQFDQIPFDMVPGPEPEPMDVAGTVLANAICFDIAYAGAIRDQIMAGAELIVVQTSNATFAGTSQPEQQFAISRARALETQRFVAVVSLNGVTGVIDSNGEVVSQLAPSAITSLTTTVELSGTLSPAVRLGPYLSDLILLGTGVAVAAHAAEIGRTKRSTRRASREPSLLTPPG